MPERLAEIRKVGQHAGQRTRNEPRPLLRNASYNRGMPASPQRDERDLAARPSVVCFGFDVLGRIEQAVAMVKERLRRAVAALEAAGIPHAVCGGHAVAAWVARIDPAAVRTTVDVDILIERADLPRTITALDDLSQTDSQEGYPIVDFERLVGMKLTAFRDKDRTHLRDMIDVGLITPVTLNQLPAPLRPRL